MAHSTSHIGAPVGPAEVAMRLALLLLVLVALSISLAFGQTAVKPVDKNSLRLILPPEIPAVPGREVNIYFDNVILTPRSDMYLYDVECLRGVQQEERFTWTPTAQDLGQIGLTLRVYDLHETLVAEGSTIINVRPPDAGAGKAVSMLLVGDSLTNAGVYGGELLALCQQPGNPAIRLIGSPGPGGRNSGDSRHEGYGGWTAERFVTMWEGQTWNEEGRRTRSPFLYEKDGKPTLDFAQYCADFNGGQAPDIITIFLGCNDTFGSSEARIDETVDRFLGHMQTLVKEFRRVGPQTKIGIISLVPPAASQDSSGAVVACYQTRWQYRRNVHRVLERSREVFGGREAENILLIPAYVNLDCVHNYPTSTGPANSRSEVVITRQNNDVHPAASGYKQIADTLYCWLKAQTAK